MQLCRRPSKATRLVKIPDDFYKTGDAVEDGTVPR